MVCDECGQAFNLLVNAPSDVEITKAEGHRASFPRTMCLLKFDGKRRPVFFVMDHKRYHSGDTETEQEIQGSLKYFFEDHSCPTNWLHECVEVIEDGDTDPHGFLDFVRCVDVPSDFNEHQASWEIMFPEAFDGETIDGTVNRPPKLVIGPVNNQKK